MTNQKLSGAYYTPTVLSDFLTDHIFDNYIIEKKITILEPAVGDGQFIKSLINSMNPDVFETINLDIVDINNTELLKAESYVTNDSIINLKSFKENFLNLYLEKHNKYSLIIGNPPYIQKKNMDRENIELCEMIHSEIKEYSSTIQSNGLIKNIWPAFVKSAIMSLEDNGILCFVIPSEILQVKYAAELRNLIHTEFDRVEIFTFNELIFSDIEQDVIALIGIKKVNNTEKHGVSFYHVQTLDDLKVPKYTEKFSNIHRTTLDKWTNYILHDKELNFLDSIKNKFKPITLYCTKAQVGVVTAANKYFIRCEDDIIRSKLDTKPKLIKPILSKWSLLSGMLDFKIEDYDLLRNKLKKDVCFIHFPDKPIEELSEYEASYIEWGESEKEDSLTELHKRYKMTTRTNWYHVPNVWKAEVLFSKRSHLYPKLIVNSADVYATDSFYGIHLKKEYSTVNFVFSFYNSLTLVLAELEGRFYGGGVLELTPNEFKNLIIPYSEDVTKVQFNKLDRMLRKHSTIEEILNYTDAIILKDLKEEEISRLREIRNKLVRRRLKLKE